MRAAFFVFLFPLVFAPLCLASETPPPAVSYAAHGFQSVLLRCPGKIWPRLFWGEFQFLYSTPTSSEAWLVSRENAEAVRVVKDSQLRRLFLPGFNFDFFEFRHRKTIAVNLEGLEKTEGFRLAVREFFRDSFSNIRLSPLDHEQKGLLFPLAGKPRFLRRMVFENLKRAFREVRRGGEGAQYLGQARYWSNQWQLEFGEEVPLHSDSIEGSMHYVELLSVLFSETSCGAGQEEFWRAFERLAWPAFVLNPEVGFARESELMGGLAAILLNLKSRSWQHLISDRRSPLDILLESERAQFEPESLDLREEYLAATERNNLLLDQVLSPELARLDDFSVARVSVPASWQVGSFLPKESFVLRGRRDLGIQIVPEGSRFQGKGGVINPSRSAISFQSARNECNGLLYFLVPLREIRRQEHTFQLLNLNLSFSFHARSRVVDGFTWLCPQE